MDEDLQVVDRLGIRAELSKPTTLILDKQGDVSRARMARGGGKVPKGRPQKVVKVGIEREEGFLYFIDKKGNVCKVKMARSNARRRKTTARKKPARRKTAARKSTARRSTARKSRREVLPGRSTSQADRSNKSTRAGTTVKKAPTGLTQPRQPLTTVDH